MARREFLWYWSIQKIWETAILRVRFWTRSEQEVRSNGNPNAPGVLNLLGTPEDQDFLSQMSLVATNLYNEFGNEIPWNPVTIDLRPEDKSLFGIRHVAMNSPELVLPSPNQPGFAAKVSPARTEPYVSVISFPNGRTMTLDEAMRYAVSAEALKESRLFYYMAVLFASRTSTGQMMFYGVFDAGGARQNYALPLSWRSRALAGFRVAR